MEPCLVLPVNSIELLHSAELSADIFNWFADFFVKFSRIFVNRNSGNCIPVNNAWQIFIIFKA